MFQLVFSFFLFFSFVLEQRYMYDSMEMYFWWKMYLFTSVFDRPTAGHVEIALHVFRSFARSSFCFEFVQHPSNAKRYFSWVQSCFVFERTGRYISSTVSLRIRLLCRILWNNASGAGDKLSFGAFRSRGGIFDTQNERKSKRHYFCMLLKIFIR